MALYTISVFFSSNGLRFFMYRGPAYKQKYKYVTRMVNNGPGDPDRSHGFVLGSATLPYRELVKRNIYLYIYMEIILTLVGNEEINYSINYTGVGHFYYCLSCYSQQKSCKEKKIIINKIQCLHIQFKNRNFNGMHGINIIYFVYTSCTCVIKLQKLCTYRNYSRKIQNIINIYNHL